MAARRITFLGLLALLGYRHSNAVGQRIYQADGEAEEGQFPYQVFIEVNMEQPNNSGEGCGGTLIHPDWVLTAAHCFVGNAKHPAYVFFNLLDASPPSLQNPSVEYRPSQYSIIHEEYDSVHLVNDIALIRLSRPAPDDAAIGVLADSNLDASVFDKMDVCVSGYGLTDDRTENTALNWARVEMMPSAKCKALTSFVDDRKLCTSRDFTEARTCHGDSGGPLAICPTGGDSCGCDHSDARVIGIVSYSIGTGCGNQQPDYFTNVAYYREWINDKTNGEV